MASENETEIAPSGEAIAKLTHARAQQPHERTDKPPGEKCWVLECEKKSGECAAREGEGGGMAEKTPLGGAGTPLFNRVHASNRICRASKRAAGHSTARTLSKPAASPTVTAEGAAASTLRS